LQEGILVVEEQHCMANYPMTMLTRKQALRMLYLLMEALSQQPKANLPESGPVSIPSIAASSRSRCP